MFDSIFGFFPILFRRYDNNIANLIAMCHVGSEYERNKARRDHSFLISKVEDRLTKLKQRYHEGKNERWKQEFNELNNEFNRYKMMRFWKRIPLDFKIDH